MSSLFKNLVLLGLAAFAGFVLYKLWQAVAPAISSLGNTATEAGSVVGAISGEATAAASAISNFVSDPFGFIVGDEPTLPPAGPYYNELAQAPAPAPETSPDGFITSAPDLFHQNELAAALGESQGLFGNLTGGF